MTEAERLASDDPRKMLASLRGRASPRKLRLFTCAVARLLPPPEDAAEGRERDGAVRVAERFADGAASARELARASVCSAGEGFWSVAHPDAFEAAEFAAAEDQLAGREPELAALLREVFGPCPTRPATADPAWLAWNGGTVRRLARAIYDERAFDRLPVLADALEDAGCADPDVLAHCRSEGEHVRGCWVVDLLLGKE